MRYGVSSQIADISISQNTNEHILRSKPISLYCQWTADGLDGQLGPLSTSDYRMAFAHLNTPLFESDVLMQAYNYMSLEEEIWRKYNRLVLLNIIISYIDIVIKR